MERLPVSLTKYSLLQSTACGSGRDELPDDEDKYFLTIVSFSKIKNECGRGAQEASQNQSRGLFSKFPDRDRVHVVPPELVEMKRLKSKVDVD